MMTRKLTTSLIAACFMIIVNISANAAPKHQMPEKLILVNSDLGLPPLISLVDNLADYLRTRLSIPMEYLIVSNARIHISLSSDRPACSLIVARVPAFESNYSWLRKTGITNISIFEVSKRQTDTKASPDHPILVLRDSATETLARKMDLNYLSLNSRRQIVEMLAAGRSDTWLAYDGAAHVIDSRVEHFELKRMRAVAKGSIWLACSQVVPKALQEELATIWDKGMTNGDIPAFYKQTGLTSFLPDPDTSTHGPM